MVHPAVWKEPRMSIVVNLPAVMECDAPGCNDKLPVKLLLLNSGGFGFNSDSKLWHAQFATNAVAPYRTLCPKHANRVETTPAIPGLRAVQQ